MIGPYPSKATGAPTPGGRYGVPPCNRSAVVQQRGYRKVTVIMPAPSAAKTLSRVHVAVSFRLAALNRIQPPLFPEQAGRAIHAS